MKAEDHEDIYRLKTEVATWFNEIEYNELKICTLTSKHGSDQLYAVAIFVDLFLLLNKKMHTGPFFLMCSKNTEYFKPTITLTIFFIVSHILKISCVV